MAEPRPIQAVVTAPEEINPDERIEQIFLYNQDGTPYEGGSGGSGPGTISPEGWDVFGNLAGSGVTDLQTLADFINDMKWFTFQFITKTPNSPGSEYALGSEGYAAVYNIQMQEDTTILLYCSPGFSEYIVKVENNHAVSWGGNSVLWRGTADKNTPPVYANKSIYKFTCAGGYLFGELLGSNL